MVRLFVHVSKSTRADFDLRHRVPPCGDPGGCGYGCWPRPARSRSSPRSPSGCCSNALLDQQRAAGPARNVTEARNAINAIQRLSLDLETGARGFLLTQDRSFLDPYTAARRELPRQLAALAAVPNDAGQRARIGRAAACSSPRTRAISRTSIGRADASAVTAQEGGASSTRSARRSRSWTPPSARSCSSAAPRARTCASARSSSPASGSRSCCVLIALISFGAVRGVVIPVDRLQGFARELGARRYGARLPESGPPETVELAQAFNATAVSLEAAEAELRRIGERHLAELDAVFRRGAARAGVRRPRPALPARQRGAGADEPGARRRAPRASAVGSPGRASPRSSEVIATGEPVLDARAWPPTGGASRPATSRSATAATLARGRRSGDRRHGPPPRGGRARAPAARHRGAGRDRDRRRRRRGRGGGGARRRSTPTAPRSCSCDGDWLELIAIDGLNAEERGRLAQVPLTARRARAEAVRTGAAGLRADPGADGGALPRARRTRAGARRAPAGRLRARRSACC